MEGWIKLHRKIQDNPLWTCEPFTRGQAWVDLLLLANHEYGFFFKRGVKIEVSRGQVGVSEVGLSDRWKWSRSKVRKFLNDLKKEQQIEIVKSNVSQIVTLINYAEYQQKEQQPEQQKDNRKTPKGQQKDTNKNDKNNKEEIYNAFYDSEIQKSENNPDYIKFIQVLFGKNSLNQKLESVLAMQYQMNYEQFKQLMYFKSKYKINVTPLLESMENNKKLKDRKSLWLSFQTYMKTAHPETKN